MERLLARCGQAGVDLVEFVFLILIPHESFDGTDRGQPLLDNVVQTVHHGLQFCVHRGNSPHNQGENKAKKRGTYKEYKCQPRIHIE